MVTVRFVAAVVALSVSAWVANVGTASAATWYPYCGVYQDRSGAWSCRFPSEASCNAVMRAGNTGFCRENPAPPPERMRRRRR